MAINERLIDTEVAAANGGNGAASAEQNLILHLDANDVDSYDGDGDVWYDISEHDLTIPLSDNADDLELHLNASDTDSYDPATDTTTWTDISGNSRNATLTSLTNTDHDIDNGGYFELDGSNDYVVVPHDSSLDPSTNFTVEAWVNRDTNNQAYFLMKQGGSGAYGYHFQYHNQHGYDFQVYNTSNGGAYARLSTSNSGSTGEWHHLVGTLDGTNLKLYFNGEEVDSSAWSGTPATNTSDLHIGQNSTYNNSRWNGKIGAVRFYSKALSASEVGQNYRHGRDYIYTDLIDDTDLELHLDAGNTDSYDPSSDGSTWSDLAGSNNATMTSMNASQHDKEIGGWFDFDGSSDYMTVPSNSAFDLTNDLTIELWCKMDNIPADTDVLSRMNSSSPYNGFILRLHQTYGWYFYDYGTTSYIRAGNTAANGYTTGKWQHIVLTWDASAKTPTFYVDGEDKSGTKVIGTGSPVSFTKDLSIGYGPFANNKFDGQIGQIRWYSKTFTADEVMQNYLFTKNNYPNEFHLTGTNMDSADWNSDGYFDFNGSDEYFYDADYPVDFGTSSYTVIMWFNSDTNNANKALFSTYNATGLMIDLRTDGTIRHYHDGGITQLQYNTSETISTGTWYQLAVTFDRSNDTGSMYLSTKSTFDSAASTSTASGGATNKGNGGTNIGRYNNGFYYNGKIANVRVYDKALSSSEIEAVWNTDKGDIPT